ncbi:MAG: ATP-binding protein, partial [archaeon]|nr:ATP-binding protein [archaeon]
KVVTGMRRSGKSTLLEQYASGLVDSGVPEGSIFFLNFDDIGWQHLSDSVALNGWITENIPKDRQCYVFLDEVQNVDGWERSVSGLQNMSNCDVYVTGSNSKMLSSELATHISGRYIEIGILPLSFKEYLELHPSEDVEGRFRQFLSFGGLPAVDPNADKRFNDGLLEGVFNTVLVKDMLSRLKTDDVSKLTAIARFLYSNIGNITNIDHIAEATGIGNPTVSRYVDEMCKAFLFYRSERYDMVGKKILKTNGKYYASDLGLRNTMLGRPSAGDISRPLENVVYLELLRRGYTVRTGSYRDREVDFTATDGEGTEYFQVCQTMMAEGTYEREMRSLKGIKDNCPKTVLTLDRFGLGSDEGIKVVNVIDWLLDKDRSR